MYIVLRAFHDLEDAVQTKAGPIYHYYNPGDVFPRAGKRVSQARCISLATCDNAQGRPLIALVDNSRPAGDDASENADSPTVSTDTKAVEKPKKKRTRKAASKEKVMKSAT